MKRFTALWLVLTLILTLVAIPAFAEESTVLTDETTTITYMRSENAPTPIKNGTPS
ncbi:MAG: hypothetical protein LLF96_06925 [Eubacteriales bacterium]|nr:hypothetical protein [Eubacteriales bacterium]